MERKNVDGDWTSLDPHRSKLTDYGGTKRSGSCDIRRRSMSGKECGLAELRHLMQVDHRLVNQYIEKEYGSLQEFCQQRLKCDTTLGLSAEDEDGLNKRRELFGNNDIPPKATKWFVWFIWEALQDPTLIILTVAAIISLGLTFYYEPDILETTRDGKVVAVYHADSDPTERSSGWIEAVGILMAVIIVVMVTACVNWSKDKQFRGLQNRIGQQFQTTVVRSGLVLQLPVTEIVVGDICIVKYGDIIPADGVLLSSSDLKVDQSSHTGESKDVRKSPSGDPLLYAGTPVKNTWRVMIVWLLCNVLLGTQVMEGNGRMVVTAVGPNSAKGIIFALLGVTYNDENEPEVKHSILHSKLVKTALHITYAGTILALLTFVILVLRFCIETFWVQGQPWQMNYMHQFVRFLIISITLLAVAVPEGLPLAVVLALAYSVKKMMLDNSLVRHLDACETMGNATTICCDKTGTLTTNRMTAVESYVAGQTYNGDHGHRRLLELPNDLRLVLATCISINTSYTSQLHSRRSIVGRSSVSRTPSIFKPFLSHLAKSSPLSSTTPGGNGNNGTPVGSKTECALLDFVRQLGYDYAVLRLAAPEAQFLHVYTFRSDRKWMGTVTPLTVCLGNISDSSGTEGYGSEGWEGDGEGRRKRPFPGDAGMRGVGVEGRKVSSPPGGGRVGEVGKEGSRRGSLGGEGQDDSGLSLEGPDSSFTDTQACRLIVTGAAEIVLNRCLWMVGDGLSVKSLSGDERSILVSDVITPMCRRGLRTLCIAYKDFLATDDRRSHEAHLTPDIDWNDESVVSDAGLVCLAIIGIEDPVRPEVPLAIRRCQQAGIVVRMVTGDNVNTARYVASKCGILESPLQSLQGGEQGGGVLGCWGGGGGRAEEDVEGEERTKMREDVLVLDASEFNKMIRKSSDGPVDEALMDEVWPRLRVLARSTPQDKYNLVKGIMESKLGKDGEIVAVTGDGTNDGPALKKAHVGLAMGITGTDVAKEASDIILIDDNFASIVRAVVWGRHVNDSIAKFLQFQLTVNIVAVIMALVGACIIMDSPLKGIQMLWVNLLMDTLASLSLATERPTDDVLKRRPYGKTRPLISPTMLFNILAHSFYQLCILLTLLFTGEQLLDVDNGRSRLLRGIPSVHYTVVFNSFVMMILFNEINARKIDRSINVFSGLQRSHIFIVIWFTSFTAQVMIVHFGGAVFCTVRLSLEQWFWCLVFGIGNLLYGQLLTATCHLVSFIQERIERRTIKSYDEIDSTTSKTTKTVTPSLLKMGCADELLRSYSELIQEEKYNN